MAAVGVEYGCHEREFSCRERRICLSSKDLYAIRGGLCHEMLKRLPWKAVSCERRFGALRGGYVYRE